MKMEEEEIESNMINLSIPTMDTPPASQFVSDSRAPGGLLFYLRCLSRNHSTHGHPLEKLAQCTFRKANQSKIFILYLLVIQEEYSVW